MTITQSLYIRRNGGMVFFRLFRLGGSFYLSTVNAAAAKEQRQAATLLRRNAERELRAAVRFIERTRTA